MGIGALRFWLSLMVIDSHYGILANHIQVAALNRFGIDHLAYIGTGGIAVSGFFVVSGYLITLVLARKYDTDWKGVGAFYVSRALRIYPLYWLLFAAYWITLAGQGSAPTFSVQQVFANLTLIPYGVAGMATDQNESGLSSASDPLLIGPAWTLCYDLLFYLLAPWLFVKLRTSWWVFMIGLAYILTFVLFADHRPPIWFQFFYGTGLPYLFMFACGALAYHHRATLRVRAGPAIALIAGLCWVTYFPLALTNTYLNSLIATLLFTPLVATLGRQASNPRTDRVLGDLTYATYLLHLPLLLLAQRMAWPFAAVSALALTYLGAVVLLVGFEYPLDRLRDYLYERSRQGQRASQPARMMTAVPLVIVFMLLGAAIVSLWSNLWRAGNEVELHVDACPSHWRCDSGTLAVDGAGQAELVPALPVVNRVVFDLYVRPGAGELWAGVVSPDQAFRAGVRRSGDQCHFEIWEGAKMHGDPQGWRTECRSHRVVLSRIGDRMMVIVDSMWTQAPVAAPRSVRVVARAQADSRGTLSYDHVFVTRR